MCPRKMQTAKFIVLRFSFSSPPWKPSGGCFSILKNLCGFCDFSRTPPPRMCAQSFSLSHSSRARSRPRDMNKIWRRVCNLFRREIHCQSAALECDVRRMQLHIIKAWNRITPRVYLVLSARRDEKIRSARPSLMLLCALSGINLSRNLIPYYYRVYTRPLLCCDRIIKACPFSENTANYGIILWSTNIDFIFSMSA